MKLQEAIEKATKGPLVPCRGSHAYPLELLTDTKTVAQIEHGKTLEQTDCNAALLAHWYNVGPKLLDALSIAVQYVPLTGEDADIIEKVSKEANEVEGI